MCNIAGYVGNKRAAPILIEMLKREEGFDAGYYTGIATLHEGRIHYRKITGDLAHLLECTDAKDLPGNIGIIHGRTKSGGPDAWSHPFVSDGKFSTAPTVAYVANGNSGIFKDRDPEYNRLAENLISEGYRLDSEIECEDGIYNRLSSGKMVHMSDVMCALVARNIDLGIDVADAMGRAYCEMPGEIVGLLLSTATPNAIAYARINRPMTLSFANHGAYLASTLIAHPDDKVGAPIKLPELSCGYVTANGFTQERLKSPPTRVACLGLSELSAAYGKVCEELKEPKHLYEVIRAIRPFFNNNENEANEAAATAYTIIEAINATGRLEIIRGETAGVKENTVVPRWTVRIK